MLKQDLDEPTHTLVPCWIPKPLPTPEEPFLRDVLPQPLNNLLLVKSQIYSKQMITLPDSKQ